MKQGYIIMAIISTLIGSFLGGALFCFLIGWAADRLIVSRFIDDRINAIAVSGAIGGVGTMLLAFAAANPSWGFAAYAARAAGCALGWYMRHFDAKKKLNRA